ncbi:hypothetical protein J6590_019369 [Homalodisca vitripennis]|nr:hypothetical protein J6590_019369 [Homalodisca vitripennis]
MGWSSRSFTMDWLPSASEPWRISSTLWFPPLFALIATTSSTSGQTFPQCLVNVDDKKLSGKSKDEQMAEKKQELEKRLQDVTGQLGTNKKQAKKESGNNKSVDVVQGGPSSTLTASSSSSSDTDSSSSSLSSSSSESSDSETELYERDTIHTADKQIQECAGPTPHYNPLPEGAPPARFCSEICFCAGFLVSGLSIVTHQEV